MFTFVLFVGSVLGQHSVSSVKSAALENNMFHTSDSLPSTPLSEPLWVNPYAFFRAE